MPNLVRAILIVATLTPPALEKEGVRISVSVRSHIYTWEVANLDAPPITLFEVRAYRCYSQLAPDGWSVEVDGPLFLARAESQRHAILPGQSKVFTARTQSAGAELGRVPASVAVTSGDREASTDRIISFPEVWGPVPRRRSMVARVALLVVFIAVIHTVLVARRGRLGAS